MVWDESCTRKSALHCITSCLTVTWRFQSSTKCKRCMCNSISFKSHRVTNVKNGGVISLQVYQTPLCLLTQYSWEGDITSKLFPKFAIFVDIWRSIIGNYETFHFPRYLLICFVISILFIELWTNGIVFVSLNSLTTDISFRNWWYLQNFEDRGEINVYWIRT